MIKVTLLFCILFVCIHSEICYGRTKEDANSCNSFGTCITKDTCLCHSGYTGVQCQNKLNSTKCQWNTPKALQTDYYPILDQSTTDFVNDNLVIQILGPFVKGRTGPIGYIQNPSKNNCRFPNELFINQFEEAGPCYNRYVLTFPWKTVKDCDWERREQPGFLIFIGKVYLTQNETITGQLRGKDVERTITRAYPIVVKFRTEVILNTVVKVYSQVAVKLAITKQKYNPDDKTGEFGFTTSVQYPFMVDPDKPFFVTTVPTGIVSNLEYLPSLTDCTEGNPCTQKWRMPLNIRNACSLSGNYRIFFKLRCHPALKEDCSLQVTPIPYNPTVYAPNVQLFYPQNTTNVVIDLSQLFKPVDDLGRKIVFSGFIPCDQLDPKTYCIGGFEPVVNKPSVGYATLGHVAKDCREDMFRYCIQVENDITTTSCNNVTITYQDCTCYGQMDVVFVIDSSSYVSDSQWLSQLNLFKNLTKKLIISNDNVNVGIIQYGTNAVQHSTLSGNSTLIMRILDGLKTKHLKSKCNHVGALVSTINLLNSSPKERVEYPKIIIFAMTGPPNYPCNCDKCDNDDGSKDCSWNPNNGKFCLPCSDPTPQADIIRNWKKKYSYKSNWKLVTFGLGSEITNYNEKAKKLSKNMNDKSYRSHINTWEKIETLVMDTMDDVCDIDES